MKIKSVMIDFHGCLTNGKMNISGDGKISFEQCHVRDTQAIRELVARGYHVMIVTQSSSPIIDAYAEKLGVIKVTLRDKSKFHSLAKNGFGFTEPFCAIGDSSADIALLSEAHVAMCPKDACDSVKSIPNIVVLSRNGGDAIMPEVVSIIESINNQSS